MSASTEILAPTLVAAAPASHAEEPEEAPRAGRPADPALGLIDARGDLLAGRYRIDGVVAEGGMAVVYRAWHCLLEQPVALKMLRSEYSSVPEIAERFLGEARAVARLRSKHAVRVMDFGCTTEGNRYMVLELLNGKDLQQLMTQEGAQPIDRAVGFVLQAAEAVAEAHATGLVHRDIKPANLFLAKEDGTEIIKVIDFGICKSLCRRSEYRTLSKSYLGSPQYMSPEQIQSAASVDARTDIWSLGVVLYELCTGQPPFRGATLPALCASVMVDTPSWPEHLPQELGRITMRCLAKRREERYPTVTEFVADLTRFMGIPEVPQVQSDPGAVSPHSRVRTRRGIVGWFQKAMVCGLLTGAAGVLGWGVDAVDRTPSSNSAPGFVAPALANAALDPAQGALADPVTVEPAALGEDAAPALYTSDSAPTQQSTPRTPAKGKGVGSPKPHSAPTSTPKRVEPPKPSVLDMEARYALTYEPDPGSRIVRQEPGLVSARPPEAPITDAAFDPEL